MTFLIDDNELNRVKGEVDFGDALRRGQYIEPDAGGPLEKYILLTEFPGRFEVSADKVAIFYNRLYWFVKFVDTDREKNGPDAGIDQQEFKLLEEGDRIEGIDWSVVEQIFNERKK